MNVGALRYTAAEGPGDEQAGRVRLEAGVAGRIEGDDLGSEDDRSGSDELGEGSGTRLASKSRRKTKQGKEGAGGEYGAK